MRRRVIPPLFLAGLALALVGLAPQVQAEIGASGTRLALPGGAPRFYMTYGHADEPELYAPILPGLKRLGIVAQRKGDDYLFYRGGQKIAEWPIVTSRDDVPETGEHPCVLVMGGNSFVPVKRLAQMLGLDIRWDKGNNLMALVPDPEKQKAVAGADVEAPPLTQLTGVSLEQEGGRIVVRVMAALPVTPTWLTLTKPDRIVLDFENAKWAPGVQVPAGLGTVKEARTGQFTPTTARLVLAVTSGAVRLTQVKVTSQEIVAAVGSGAQVRQAEVEPEADRLLAAIRTRRAQALRTASRSSVLPGGLDGSVPVPFPQGPIEILPRIDLPSVVDGTLAGKVICVDAGHGGRHSGAKGLNHLEKDLCLKMALQFQQALEARGATVLMTRTSDVFVSLDDRCKFANSRNADIFISIHCNSTPRRNSANGSETYWRTPQSYRLAVAMHRRLVATVGRRDGGIRNRSFAVIRETTMPSVLLEIAYINNTNDELLLSSGDFHGQLAQSLTLGVLDYFKTQGE